MCGFTTNFRQKFGNGLLMMKVLERDHISEGVYVVGPLRGLGTCSHNYVKLFTGVYMQKGKRVSTSVYILSENLEGKLANCW